jgi:hypothetical protein
MCMTCWCFSRLIFEVGRWSYSLHGYCLPLCTVCWCRVRLLFVLAWYSHSLHGYLFPSCTKFWCSCLVLTLAWWMLLYFMYQLLVLNEIIFLSFFTNCLCCLGLPLFIFHAWIRLSFMYRMPVLSGITLYSYLVFTFTAWVLSFM